MKITDKQLKELLLKTFESLDNTKEACKLTISQCIRSPNPIVVIKLTQSCLETIDVVDLCKLFVTNMSPNVKQCLGFTISVLKTNLLECKKVENDPYCKNMIQYCEKTIFETIRIIAKLQSSIS